VLISSEWTPKETQKTQNKETKSQPVIKNGVPVISPSMTLTAFKRACSFYFRFYDKSPEDGVLSLSEFRNIYLRVLPDSIMRKATKWS
jgi:hypothetical protein